MPTTGSATPSGVSSMLVDADLGDGHGPDRPAQRVGHQLVPEADAEAGPPQFRDPAAYGCLLVDQPGVLLLLPDVLGSAHHHEHVEGLEFGYRLARIELHGLQGEPGAFEKGSERAGIFVGVVLEDEYPSGVVCVVGSSERGASRHREGSRQDVEVFLDVPVGDRADEALPLVSLVVEKYVEHLAGQGLADHRIGDEGVEGLAQC